MRNGRPRSAKHSRSSKLRSGSRKSHRSRHKDTSGGYTSDSSNEGKRRVPPPVFKAEDIPKDHHSIRKSDFLDSEVFKDEHTWLCDEQPDQEVKAKELPSAATFTEELTVTILSILEDAATGVTAKIRDSGDRLGGLSKEDQCKRCAGIKPLALQEIKAAGGGASHVVWSAQQETHGLMREGARALQELCEVKVRAAISITKRRAHQHLERVRSDLEKRYLDMSERFQKLCTAQQQRIAKLETELEAPTLEGYRKPPPIGETFVERILRTEDEYQTIITNILTRPKDERSVKKLTLFTWHRAYLCRWREDMLVELERLDFLKEELAKERNKNEDLSKSLSKVKIGIAAKMFAYLLMDNLRVAFVGWLQALKQGKAAVFMWKKMSNQIYWKVASLQIKRTSLAERKKALMHKVYKLFRPMAGIRRPFRAWRRIARKLSMASRAELVHAAGHSVKESAARLLNVLKTERSERSTQMALVEETIEVFMRINKVLGTDYTQMKQGQWLHFVSERRQIQVHLAWLHAAWKAFTEGGIAMTDAHNWLEGGQQWRRERESWTPALTGASNQNPSDAPGSGDLVSKWLQRRHQLAGYPLWKIPLGDEGNTWLVTGVQENQEDRLEQERHNYIKRALEYKSTQEVLLWLRDDFYMLLHAAATCGGRVHHHHHRAKAVASLAAKFDIPTDLVPQHATDPASPRSSASSASECRAMPQEGDGPSSARASVRDARRPYGAMQWSRKNQERLSVVVAADAARADCSAARAAPWLHPVKINVDAASAPATARTSEHARGSARSASPSIVAALEDAKTLAGPRGHVAGNVHAYGVIGAPDKHGHAEGGASRSFLMQGPTGRGTITPEVHLRSWHETAPFDTRPRFNEDMAHTLNSMNRPSKTHPANAALALDDRGYSASISHQGGTSLPRPKSGAARPGVRSNQRLSESEGQVTLTFARPSRPASARPVSALSSLR